MSRKSELRREATAEFESRRLTFYVPPGCKSEELEVAWAKGKRFWYCKTTIAKGGSSVVAYEPGELFAPLQKAPRPGPRVGWIESGKVHGKVLAMPTKRM